MKFSVAPEDRPKKEKKVHFIVFFEAEVKIVIADFNTDYPFTYVLVEPAKKLYTVVFHDPEDYDNEEYGLEGGQARSITYTRTFWRESAKTALSAR